MKTLIIIPTYNEKDNIERLLPAIAHLNLPQLEVLVVDDSSPDGTSQKVAQLAATISLPVHLLRRGQKQGLGKAYIAGFHWALAQDYDFVISMDADFSHDPVDIPRFLQVGPGVDLVIGSRYIPGGRVVGWNLSRQLNSRGANMVTRAALGIAVKDVTAGYRRYSRRFLQSLDMAAILSSGYAFQVEMVLHGLKNTFIVQEIPILFIDRRVGESKISGEMFRSAGVVARLFARRIGLKK